MRDLIGCMQNSSIQSMERMLFLLLASMFILANRDFLSDAVILQFSMSMFELCPYFPDCDSNITDMPDVADGYEPCCKQCSCNPDCGITRNCCKEQFDKTVGILNEVCSYPVVMYSSETPHSSEHYFIVQDCPEENASVQNCNDFKGGPWGAMYPVTSPSKGYTFLNQNCAQCNGVNNGIRWQVFVTCSTSSHIAAGSTTIEKVKNPFTYQNDCSIILSPEDSLSEYTHVCHPDIITQCNVYGYLTNITDEMEQLCQGINATYTHFTNGQRNKRVFRNVYCFLCNIPNGKALHECPTDNDIQNVLLSNMFVSLLKNDLIDSLVRLNTEGKDNDVQSTQSVCGFLGDGKDQCRQVDCPEGQIWLAERGCSFFSQSWYSESFNLYIKLTYPRDARERMRFWCMSHHHRRGEHISSVQLHVPGLTSWKKKIYCHPNSDFTYVEHFVVKLTLSEATLHPADAIDDIAQTLNETWDITTCGSTYRFIPQFNNFIYYVDWEKQFLPNQLIGIMLYIPVYVNYSEHADTSSTRFLIDISQEVDLIPKYAPERININKGLVLTESFFCHQTYLREGEYIDYTYRLFVRKLGTYLEDGQYTRVRHGDGSSDIKVCVGVQDGYTSTSRAWTVSITSIIMITVSVIGVY